MDKQPTTPPVPPHDPSQPVAYDQYGRPLYAHPPTAPVQPTAEGQPPQPQVVYMTRAVEPHAPEISPEAKAKHERSVQEHPYLNLSEGEYVISMVRRHPIGLISIWAVVAAAVLVELVGLPLLLAGSALVSERLSAAAMLNGGLVLLLTAALFVMGGVIATVVYRANRFYLTNESVIQHIQTSLFSKKDQTISLASIEDASYRQQGILQTILNYGSIRLSTEGEETTYRFNFVANPKKEIDQLNNAVEAFKNFRPVEGN